MVGRLAHFAGGTARRPRTLKVQPTSDCLLVLYMDSKASSLCLRGKFSSNNLLHAVITVLVRQIFLYCSMSLVRQAFTKASIVPRRTQSTTTLGTSLSLLPVHTKGVCLHWFQLLLLLFLPRFVFVPIYRCPSASLNNV